MSPKDQEKIGKTYTEEHDKLKKRCGEDDVKAENIDPDVQPV